MITAMAYDADACLDPVLDVYVASVVKLDHGWYVQCDNYSLEVQRVFDSEAIETADPFLIDWLSKFRRPLRYKMSRLSLRKFGMRSSPILPEYETIPLTKARLCETSQTDIYRQSKRCPKCQYQPCPAGTTVY